MNVKEYATKHGLNPETVRRQIRDGHLRARKIGRGYEIATIPEPLVIKLDTTLAIQGAYTQATTTDDLILVSCGEVNFTLPRVFAVDVAQVLLASAHADDGTL